MKRSAVLFVLCIVLMSVGATVSAQPECAPTPPEEASEAEAEMVEQTAPDTTGSTASAAVSREGSTVALYGWITGVNATIRAGAVESKIDASFSDILDNLDAGLMLYYEVLNEDTGFYLDVIYARLSEDIERNLVTIDYEVKQTVIEAGALLRRGAPEKGVDVILGVRYVDMDNEVGLSPPDVRASAGVHWLDPVLGVRYRTALSNRWAFSGRGDIGGFGLGSDFSWQLVGVFRYQMSKRWSLALGYRYLDMDYDESDFAFNGAMSGPLVGFAYGW